jgi:hypothetical protein
VFDANVRIVNQSPAPPSGKLTHENFKVNLRSPAAKHSSSGESERLRTISHIDALKKLDRPRPSISQVMIADSTSVPGEMTNVRSPGPVFAVYYISPAYTSDRRLTESLKKLLNPIGFGFCIVISECNT